MNHTEKLEQLKAGTERLSSRLVALKHKFVYKSDKRRAQYSEVCQWCKDNVKGEWFPLVTGNMTCYMFKDEKDAVLYKLTWG